MTKLSEQQARQFILLKQGLLDKHQFIDKQGALAFIRQAGCIQFDPVDVCGKNPELVLQSRVKGFSKTMLHELLYQDRALVDYPDKQLAIIPVEDWPWFERTRAMCKEHVKKYPGITAFTQQVKNHIKKQGYICSTDLTLDGDCYWHSAMHWSGGNNLTRSVLEHMYSTGELIIHHKKGTRKYYDLTENHLSAQLVNTPDPLPDETEHQKWRVLRRIGAIGLLWNKASDAWLNIPNFKANQRNQVFAQLIEEGEILSVAIDGIKEPFYYKLDDKSLLEKVLQNPLFTPRCELIAPLDNIMWDRRLIKALFNFDYTWEIYTPAHKRQYGHYVLPLLYGDNFIGRFEAAIERKTKSLCVKNIWFEQGVKPTKKIKTALLDCINRFATFNECDNYNLPDNLS